MILSIVVPAFNVNNYIINCLSSLVNQKNVKNRDYEIIIIDDGSTDNTYQKVLNFILKNHLKNVSIFSGTNNGSVAARLKGIEESNGDFITFVDADDFVKEDYVRKILSIIKSDSDFYLLNDYINKKNSHNFYIEKSFLNDGYVSKKEMYKFVLTGKAGAVWDKIYKASLFRNHLQCFNIDIFWGDDVFINAIYLTQVKSVEERNVSLYYHIIDSPISNSVIKVDQNKYFEKINDVDCLYNKIRRLYIDKDIDYEIFNDFCVIYLVNIAKISGELKRRGINIYDIENAISNMEIVKNELKSVHTSRISDYLYIYLLKHFSFYSINLLNLLSNFKNK